MKDGRITAKEALAAIERERRRYRDDPKLTWPEWPPSPIQPGMCPRDSCIKEPRQGVIVPTKLRVREDGRAVCGLCGYVDESHVFPYQPPERRIAVLPDWVKQR